MHSRDFILLVALSAAASPAFGQVTIDKQGTASSPDFSGVWHRWLRPGLGPPASGPGPITNRSRVNGVSNYNQLVGDYTNPILTPYAAQVVKEHGELSLKGETYPTPGNQCWPDGVPYIFWQYGMQMLQEKDKVTILYLQDQQFRQVRLNQPHPAHVTPSWYGDSVGHYEGDTLVIDTVAVKTDRPFAMVDMYGTPYSDSLHVVERYRLLDYEAAKEGIERDAKINARYPLGLNAIDYDPNYRGKHLRLEITVEDNKVFRTPWSATVTYARPVGSWVEQVCAENLFEYYRKNDSDVPTAAKPDF